MTGSPGQTRPLMCINIMSSRWAQMCHLIFFQILVCTGWYWISSGRYLLILGGTGSVLGSTDWYLVVLGLYEAELVGKGSVVGRTGCYLVLMCQYSAVLVGTWWYWVRTGRYWLPVWYAFRKYMVYMVKSIKLLNIRRRKKWLQTDTQTDRHTHRDRQTYRHTCAQTHT